MEFIQNKGVLFEEDFYFDTPYLMSLPPRPIELEYAKKRLEKIRSTGKKLVEVSCDRAIEVLKGALKLGVTQAEFDVFKNCFNTRPYRNLARSKFCNPQTLEIDIDGFLDEIFETASLFHHQKVRNYFLEEVRGEILDRYNDLWAETVFKIVKKFSARFEKLNQTYLPFPIKKLPPPHHAPKGVFPTFQPFQPSNQKLSNLNYSTSPASPTSGFPGLCFPLPPA